MLYEAIGTITKNTTGSKNIDTYNLLFVSLLILPFQICFLEPIFDCSQR